MEAVAALTQRRGIPCQVSLETPMACGIGICFTCVAAIREPDGSWDYRRTCVEGPVFNAADVVWHPSRADTSSMVSLEAFGCGTPVIAAAVGGVPEIVRDGVSGLLIPPDDPTALVTATRRLIRDPALMDRLRAGALATARDHNPDRFIDAYLAIYQKAVASPPPSKDIP